MLTQKELDAAVRKMIANLDEVNLYFIQKIATQIKKIGEMNPTSIHRYTIMLEIGADIADISGKLQAATRLTQQQMAVVYNTALRITLLTRDSKPRWRRIRCPVRRISDLYSTRATSPRRPPGRCKTCPTLRPYPCPINRP